jgi:DedD protein
MNESVTQDMEEDADLTRQRLLRRIAMAGVLIVALVASLAIFDAVFVNPPEPEAADEAAPAQVASVSVPPLEERGLEKAEEAAAEAPPEPASPEPAPPPENVEAPKPEPEPAKPAAKAKSETRPITQPPVKTAAKPVPTVPEGTGSPSVPPPPQPPAARVPPAPAPARPLTPGQGYLVQMGVFSNIANAEELKVRLDRAGIPAHIEARVQVGPFRNKAEAEAAQKKLADMGLSGLLLSPRK